jgi:hypothetical protein
MSVKLEKYLLRKRRDMDVETPDDEIIWKGIQSRLHEENAEVRHLTNKIRLLKIRNFAATAIILFSLGYIANDIVNRRSDNEGVVTLSSLNTELGRRESDYRMKVNFKTEEVRAVAGSGDEVIRQLFDEIGRLDIIYDQAMADLKKLGSDDRVINTIFSTYEQKIRLLELIILESNKSINHENNQKISL